MQRHQFQSCYADFDGHVLRIGNERVERTWRLVDGLLYAESFISKANGRSWLSRPATVPSLYPAADWSGAVDEVTFAARDSTGGPIEAPSLAVDLTVRRGEAECVYRLKVFPGAAGISLQLVTRGIQIEDPSTGSFPAAPAPKGIERSPAARELAEPIPDVIDVFDTRTLHARLVQVTLHDRTDHHDNLVFEDEWLLQPAEPIVRLVGNVFVLEDRFTGDGLIFLKQCPLRHARPVKNPVDLEVAGESCRLFGHGLPAEGGEGSVAVTLAYTGGRTGRVAALQHYQRQLRPFVPGRDGLLLSNTWGDRSKDARVSEAFVLREIEAAATLGVEVVQIDDGWQRGATANSVVAGGVWTGFWDRDPHFWDPHPQRFPNGLAPVSDAARRHGVKLGLWYAPDSVNDFAHWRRDALQVLRLHRDHGVDHFKIDAVKMYTPLGQANLRRFYDTVLTESAGRVVFDHDVTAAVRPGYFGLNDVGPIFVENRYTDWHRYWPHLTLRNFWRLAQYVDPVRLRMEFLNNARNAEVYGDDPLAPGRYSPEYLFATVMFASPLAWFEVSNLPADHARRVAPLAATCKRHRDRIFGGTITPIGSPPDGMSWTGFASSSPDGRGGYLLVFRELNDRTDATFELPMFPLAKYRVERLAGEGEAALNGGRGTVHIPAAQQFVWVVVNAP